MQVADAVRAVWDEPRVPAPGRSRRWDRALAAVLVPAVLIEGVARDDVAWPAYLIALAMVCPLALLWRTQHPLAMLVIGYGAQSLAWVGPAPGGDEYGALYVTSCVLLLPYSLARWGSGRAVVVGLVFLQGCHVLREWLYGSSGVSILVGLGFLMFPAALGAAVRFWVHARRRDREEIRMREREQLARELHDTVAHHVSGILLQAQAGQAVGATDPSRAMEVLRTVEGAAARSLVEMRSLVALLREGEEPERAPARSIGDLPRLAEESAGEAPVDLSVSGDLDDLGSSTQAVVYRLVQESITNARWHASNATRILVTVTGEDSTVTVTVTDDGRPAGRNGRGGRPGYGLVGMTERVELLGGSLQAGADPQGGWTVHAVIPRIRAAR